MTAVQRIRAALDHQNQPYVPRGEFWLGNEVFRQLRFDGEDSLQTHIKLCQELGMDFLSLAVKTQSQTQVNYRRFTLDEVGDAVTTSGLFICAVIDGPFQRLAKKAGHLPPLAALLGNSRSMNLEEVTYVIENAIAALVERGVNAVVIADDIAYQRSTYASPQALKENLLPLYSKLVSQIHSGNAYALFHSDGNIASLIPNLISCGFEGLAGCEPECLDLITLKKTYGSQLAFMTGIQADLLEVDSPTSTQRQDFLREVLALSRGGGFVLSSACGVNSKKAVERLKTLYAWVDEALHKRIVS